jgi:hypothetical protein
LEELHQKPLQMERIRWEEEEEEEEEDEEEAVSSTHRPLLPPKKYSWYPFLLEAESNPGPLCGRKDYVSGTIENRIRDFPACSAVPQPTAPPQGHRWPDF